MIADPAVVQAFDQLVQTANDRLTRAERIRRHVLLPAAWSAERGEVTPTLKLRRKTVESNYSETIDQLYRS